MGESLDEYLRSIAKDCSTASSPECLHNLLDFLAVALHTDQLSQELRLLVRTDIGIREHLACDALLEPGFSICLMQKQGFERIAEEV